MKMAKKSQMKVAVIGSGAAAFGVLDRLMLLVPPADITLIDRGARVEKVEQQFDCWTEDRLRLIYNQSKRAQGIVFPPPKISFGALPSMLNVEGWGSVWDSRYYGGLTNFWGLCLLPFSSRELESWPVGRTELDPHYAAIAERIGIAGEQDALNETLGMDFVNRPPIAVPPVIEILSNWINTRTPGSAYKLVAGASRLAVETRKNEANSCVACGECMLGCPRRAMYSTVPQMDAWQRSGVISQMISGRVLAIDRETRCILIEGTGGCEPIGPFDRIYVCAGCINTTEIAMRTLGQSTGPRIVDNSVYTFPIVYLGPALSRSAEQGHLALTNLLVNAVPLTSASLAAQLQIYLTFDHLWRYYVPTVLWSMMASIGRLVRCRLLIVRVYLDGEHSQAYTVHVHGERPAELSLAHAGPGLVQIYDLWAEVRRTLNGGGFHIPPIKPMQQRTSSHYAASFPLGVGPLGVDGSISPGVYLCDSSVFPTAPAASPSFTIMANARRITDISLR